jgi:hypothetical protein
VIFYCFFTATQQRPVSQLSGAQNRIKFITTESVFKFFMFKNPIFDSKIEKIGRDISKILTYSDSVFQLKIIHQKSGASDKNNPYLHR